MTGRQRSRFGFERWISLLALLAGVAALLLSWQANRMAQKANEIALRQAMPQIAVLDVKPSTSDNDPNIGKASCMHQIRLANLGGASTALVGYDATISYRGKELRLESTGESNAFSRDNLLPTITDFQVQLWSDEEPAKISVRPPLPWVTSLPFPHNIQPFTATEIRSSVWFSYDTATHQIRSGSYNDPSAPIYDPAMLDGFFPIEIKYTFHMSSGQSATGPETPCWYMK